MRETESEKSNVERLELILHRLKELNKLYKLIYTYIYNLYLYNVFFLLDFTIGKMGMEMYLSTVKFLEYCRAQEL